MKSYTDIEQSKKLAEILSIESADMGWYYSCSPQAARNQMWVGTKSENADIPCWSLAALEGLMPFQIITKNERYGFRQLKGYNTQGETYYFEYISSINQRLYETYHWNNPLDAAFEMVCWLLAEKYI
jgi:hypothetical protein